MHEAENSMFPAKQFFDPCCDNRPECTRNGSAKATHECLSIGETSGKQQYSRTEDGNQHQRKYK